MMPRSLLWFLLFCVLGCQQRKSANPAVVDKTKGVPTPAASQPEVVPTKDKSAGKLPTLFPAPKFDLIDQYDAKFSSDELAGRVWIANFIFTHCQATCPRQTAELAKLQSRIEAWPHRQRVRLISITVDPTRDNPLRLLEYAEQHAAQPDLWKFLTGPRDQLWTLSKEGFKFPVIGTGETTGLITHSSRFVLVDGSGQVRGLYESLQSEDMQQLTGDLLKLLAEPILNAPDKLIVGGPPDVFEPAWLAPRQQQQLEDSPSIKAFHDFQFEDRYEASHITFVHQPVPDSTKDFRSNHYDHGNGIAVADVDQDGLTDIYFISQVGGNQLWRNLGHGQFEDITTRAGVGLKHRANVSAAFADVDNDGDPDLYVTSTRQGNSLLLNDGSGNFTDVTEDAGLKYEGHSSAADFFDYDRDGLLDLLVSNVGKFTTVSLGTAIDRNGEKHPYYIGEKEAFAGHLFPALRERSLLYHNEGNCKFRNVSDEMGLKEYGWTGDATPIDVNNDGWLDLYIANMQGNDTLYRNVEGKRFEDCSRQWFPSPVWGGMGLKSFDANQDGQMDLMVTSMHADMWELNKGILGPAQENLRPAEDAVPSSYLRSRDTNKNVLGNALFLARSDGHFDEVAESFNAENYWPWGVSVGDLNADGYQDVFIASSMNYPFRYHVNSVRLNEGGHKFRDAEFVLGVEPRRGGRTAAPWFTLDCAGVDREHKLAQGFNQPVEVWGALGTRSSVICDLDLDGDLDIVTNEFNSAPQILTSNLSEKQPDLHYLLIKLQGKRANRDALGSKVVLQLGERQLVQVHDGQSGYISQSSLPLYFGLGPVDHVDKITVTWPGGDVQVIDSPTPGNQVLTLTQP